ncbi:unnamed protein product [Caenorhabditis brenneri]
MSTPTADHLFNLIMLKGGNFTSIHAQTQLMQCGDTLHGVLKGLELAGELGNLNWEEPRRKHAKFGDKPTTATGNPQLKLRPAYESDLTTHKGKSKPELGQARGKKINGDTSKWDGSVVVLSNSIKDQFTDDKTNKILHSSIVMAKSGIMDQYMSKARHVVIIGSEKDYLVESTLLILQKAKGLRTIIVPEHTKEETFNKYTEKGVLAKRGHEQAKEIIAMAIEANNSPSIQ